MILADAIWRLRDAASYRRRGRNPSGVAIIARMSTTSATCGCTRVSRADSRLTWRSRPPAVTGRLAAETSPHDAPFDSDTVARFDRAADHVRPADLSAAAVRAILDGLTAKELYRGRWSRNRNLGAPAR
jgi:hypothetical protein